MDFIKDDIRNLYFKMLLPSMTGAIVMSIYSFVDAIAVGQFEGVIGTGAMAVISPIYGIMIFVSILCGIGGSVMMSIARGEGNEEKGNACFTAAVIMVSVLTAACWIVLLLFRDSMFRFFGANTDVMEKTIEYGGVIITFLPLFVFPTFIGAFIRNDGAPRLVMKAVIIGGCVNMFGDWFLVFPLGMGMRGAAVATVVGTSVQSVIMAGYFLKKDCKLRLVRPNHILRGLGRILQIGIGASALDLGSITLNLFMNRQILHYAGTTELAIYGVIATIMALFQAMFAGVAQAVQPLVSTNYGAGRTKRAGEVWNMAMVTVLILGGTFTLAGELFPIVIVKLFMAPTAEALQAAPRILRLFFLVFLFLGVTILSDYYLQSVMRDKESLLIGALHSVLLSGIMCLVMPVVFGINGLWLALPVTEAILAVVGYGFVKRK